MELFSGVFLTENQGDSPNFTYRSDGSYALDVERFRAASHIGPRVGKLGINHGELTRITSRINVCHYLLPGLVKEMGKISRYGIGITAACYL